MLAAQARDLGMVALQRVDSGAAAPGSVSTWVVIARASADLDRLRTRDGWKPVRAGGTRGWTDDYSSLVQVLDPG